MKRILLVDGYNVIGAWPELSNLKDYDLEMARNGLIAKMAEYQSYTGYDIVIVFDAQYVRGTQRKMERHKVKIVFTKEDETADEYIERKAIEWKNAKNANYGCNERLYGAMGDFWTRSVTDFLKRVIF
ncbi:hypothetical protein LFLEISCH_14392 [Listeria fleischmannii subsp. fleischmannii LU2006-1]|nr:hypothetical protein LFLEISCH_14392 [Listeria fleischmannii subsp. fleischmannii LU2006-1]